MVEVMVELRKNGKGITIVCLTLDKWETVSGRFGGYLTRLKNNTISELIQLERRPRSQVGAGQFVRQAHANHVRLLRIDAELPGCSFS